MLTEGEQTIQELNPKIEWVQCTSSPCALENFASYKGTFTAPSSYKNRTGRTFTVTAQKFMRHAGVKPVSHMIFLEGGPGYPGRGYDDMISALLATQDPGPLACYTLDHRGLGESGPFGDSSKKLLRIIDDLPYIFANGPFDAKDLTLQNASLDVGMLVEAIKASPDWNPSARIVVYGFSYGAIWALHTVRLLPNMFDAMIVGGVPPIPGSSRGGLGGYAENCRRDPFCHSKMGPDVHGELRKAVLNITGAQPNACARMLFSRMLNDMPKEQSGRAVQLARLFHSFFQGNQQCGLNSNPSFKPVQLILPFLKATSDCPDPTHYLTDVLAPIKEHMDQMLPGDVVRNTSLSSGHASSSKDDDDERNTGSDPIVNSVVWIDLMPVKYTGKPPTLPAVIEDLHTSYFTPHAYWWRWKIFSRFLKGMQFTHLLPPKSAKTEMYFMASLADGNTTVIPAWEVYQSAAAPKKKWLLFANRGHDGHFGLGFYIFVHDAIYGAPHEMNLANRIDRENELTALDWKFSNHQKFASMWNHVVPGTGPASALGIPTLDTSTTCKAVINSPPPKGVLDTVYYPMSLADVMLRLIFVVSLTVGITVFFVRRHRRRMRHQLEGVV